MRILIFGGSFDPPHFGHQKMLLSAMRALKPDRVYVVPAFHSPLKVRPKTPVAHRRRMTQIFLDSLPKTAHRRIRISLFELRRGRKTFTYEVLRHFHAKYPRAELWFLIGSDSLATLIRWRRPAELAQLAQWIVGLRPPKTSSRSPRARTKISTELRRQFHIRQLSGLMPDISSTDIRARIFAGTDILAMIPSKVKQYIQRHRLYGLDIRRDLERSLSSERYKHILAVARLALALAQKHQFDPESAALAGLLHDCGRRFNLSQMVRYARTHHLRVPHRQEIIRRAPLLLHAYISADWARRHYGVSNIEILNAVCLHTLGKVGMPEFCRLLYVADASSEDRGFSKAARIRRLAFRNLNAAFRQAVRIKKEHALKTRGWLHPDTKALSRWAERL